MKRAGVVLLFLLLLSMPAYAEDCSVDVMPLELSLLDSNELLELREEIEKELIKRGLVSYFDLELNSKGESVAKLQRRLSELGYYVGNITGRYDSATRQAEKQFEKANNLENDGVASEADQQLLFSNEVLPKISATPRAVPTATPDTQLEIDIKNYGEFDYENTMRYPEKHIGEKVLLKGKVIQVIGNRTKGFQIRFSISGSSDVVYIFINDVNYNILENDRMTIYATVKGTITYSSILNQSITIPSLEADCVILNQ